MFKNYLPQIFIIISLVSSYSYSENISVVLDASFNLGSNKIDLEKYYYVINNIYKIAEDYPDAKKFVIGHTDNIGSSEFNLALSKNRAHFIADLIDKRGISKELLHIDGFGEEMPRHTNDTADGRQKNRRVEFIFADVQPDRAQELKQRLLSTNGIFETNELTMVTTLVNEHIDSSKFAEANSYKPSEQETTQVESPVEANEILSESAVDQAQSIQEQVSVDPLEEPIVETNEVETEEFQDDTLALNRTPQDESESKNLNDDVPKDTEKNPRSVRYSLNTGMYYNVLNATDLGSGAGAEWVSKENIVAGANIQTRIRGFNKAWLGLEFSTHLQKYSIVNSPGFVWDGKTPMLMRGALLLDYEIGIFGFGVNLDANQESFIFEDSGNVSLIKDLVFGGSGRFKVKLLQIGNFSSRIGAQVSYPKAGLDDIKSSGDMGYLFDIDFRLNKLIGNKALALKPYYGLRKFKNDQNTQDEKVLGLSLSLYSGGWL